MQVLTIGNWASIHRNGKGPRKWGWRNHSICCRWTSFQWLGWRGLCPLMPWPRSGQWETPASLGQVYSSSKDAEGLLMTWLSQSTNLSPENSARNIGQEISKLRWWKPGVARDHQKEKACWKMKAIQTNPELRNRVLMRSSKYLDLAVSQTHALGLFN